MDWMKGTKTRGRSEARNRDILYARCSFPVLHGCDGKRWMLGWGLWPVAVGLSLLPLFGCKGGSVRMDHV